MTVKRGKGQQVIPLEELRATARVETEPADLAALTAFMNAAGR